MDGVRQEKTVNGVTHTYYTDGTKIIAEKVGEKVFEYYYDAQGIVAFKYDGAVYYFKKNLMGDIDRIYDANKNLVAEYKYDAWGNHRVYTGTGIDITDNSSYNNSVAKLNPFRYRGYYYDAETGLYYLNSRYYDPSIGRFINADDISYIQPEQINGLNLFAYCGNNPVMYTDPTGQSVLVFLFGALIGFAVSFAVSAGTQAVFNGGQVNWGTALIDGLFGAISGALWMVPGLGPVATGLINAGLTAANGLITTGIENNWNYSWQDFAGIAFSSLVSGFVSGITRKQFLKAKGYEILTKTHNFAGTVSKRIVTGHYNNGIDVFSKSFKSAFGQMWNKVVGLNFGKGFWKEWLITLLQSIFSTSLSRGLNGLQW